MSEIQRRWQTGQQSLVIGESLVDIVIRDDAQPEIRAGGSPMNVAVGLARLGAPTTLATQFADDANGQIIDSHLAAAGVAIDAGSVRRGARTSSASARIGTDDAATYTFDIEWDGVAPSVAGQTLVHTGSIAAFLQPGADSALACLERARGVTSFDANIRPSIVGDRSRALVQMERVAQTVDILKMSDEDAHWLHPELSEAQVAQHYSDRGVALVAVTRGGSGSLIRLDGSRIDVPAPRVAVADTIGAGDSYMAGLLYALIGFGFQGRAAREFPLEHVAAAARFASACAAITVQRTGADLPMLADVLA